jgi:uncharacterized protein YodC (DUF2158 family)
MELQEGNVVQLISGGPLMTVELPEDQPSSARCFWFNINGDLQKGTFKHTMLVKKDPPKEKSGGMTWG